MKSANRWSSWNNDICYFKRKIVHLLYVVYMHSSVSYNLLQKKSIRWTLIYRQGLANVMQFLDTNMICNNVLNYKKVGQTRLYYTQFKIGCFLCWILFLGTFKNYVNRILEIFNTILLDSSYRYQATRTFC